MPDPITVIAIDPRAYFLEAIAIGLTCDREIQLLATGRSGEELEALVARLRPRIALVELTIPRRAGRGPRRRPRQPVLSTLRDLRRAFPDTRVVILSEFGRASLLSRAADAGVSGYLLKDGTDAVRLCRGVKAVAAGGMCLPRDLAERIGRRPPAVAPGPLTGRPLQALQALLDMPEAVPAEVARRLGLGEDEFAGHLGEALERLDAPTPMAGVVRALERGLIRPDWTDSPRPEGTQPPNQEAAFG